MAYSSLFPKDHRIDVQKLILLWIAQGFIIKPNHGDYRQPEKIGYEYFMTLFYGCFFQEAETDELLETIMYCKMHNLMLDLASSVAAGKRIKRLDRNPSEFERSTNRNNTELVRGTENAFEKLCHIYVDFKFDSSHQLPTLLEQKKMRTFILREFKRLSSSEFEGILSNFKLLRALSLRVEYEIETLPNSLGKL